MKNNCFRFVALQWITTFPQLEWAALGSLGASGLLKPVGPCGQPFEQDELPDHFWIQHPPVAMHEALSLPLCVITIYTTEEGTGREREVATR